ncbi:MAG TPA: CHASE domain-containing protein [Opitutaceae bacterium]
MKPTSAPTAPSGSRTDGRRVWWWPAAVASVGTLLSVTVFLQMRTRENAFVRREFERRAAGLVDVTRDTLNEHASVLHGIRTVFDVSTEVTREEFSHVARDYEQRYAGIQALEWVPRVAGAERTEYEAAARAAGFPDFRISDRSQPGSKVLVPSPSRPVHFPVYYVEPYAPNRPALGFDLVSGVTWPEMQASMRDGLLRATGRVPLLDDRAQTTFGYILHLPVYRQPLTADSPEARADAVRGFVFGVFRLSDVLARVTAYQRAAPFDVLFLDKTPAGDAQTLLYSPAGGTASSSPSVTPIDFAKSPLHSMVPLGFAGRTWELWLRPTPGWIASQKDSYAGTMLVLGLGLTGVMTAYLFSLGRRTTQIEQLVRERTAELRATQATLERDIGRRIDVERALAASEERYRAFVTQSAEGIWRVELNPPLPAGLEIEAQIAHLYAHGQLAECNDAMARLYGFDNAAQLAGTPLRQLRDPADDRHRGLLRSFLTKGMRLQEAESFETDRDGRRRIFVYSLIGIREQDSLVRIWGTQRDLTAQRQAEAEKVMLERKLLESQKLESLGMLAGGIAHDFNNLLTGIMGNASLVAVELPPESAEQQHVRQIELAALRAAELCQQMLAYSGKGRFVIEALNLSELVQNTVPLLRLSISKQAQLSFQLATDLPPVMADTTQMRQILMNLVINASDAIGNNPGEITLTTGVQFADAAVLGRAVLTPSLPEGDYVFLEVRDTGAGMAPETLARIFDPFFTTKFAGRGLGLAAVLGIVRGHQGALIVDSTLGHGSSFRLLLPRAANRSKPTASHRSANSPWHHFGRILLVDDEESVRFVTSHMLRSMGLQVDTAADGAEALSRFEDSGLRYDLVVLDLTMPGMRGDEVLQRMRKLRPEVNVLLMSGYSEEDAIGHLVQDGGSIAFLQKPFSVSALREKLRQLLGDGATK